MSFSSAVTTAITQMPLSLTLELANICNLRCSYCLRDDEALHKSKAHFFSLALFQQICADAQANSGLTSVAFTGGEPTLHPQFSDILATIAAHQLTCSFVTNGWHFERVFPAVLAHRKQISVVSFSLDGATAATHDGWRGKGSFARVMSAITRCFMSGIPFAVKVGIRRDTAAQLEAICLLAARLGAESVQFAHLLPTSAELEKDLALNLAERAEAEREIAALNHIFKIPIGLTVGGYDTNPAAPCPALAGTNCNIDYRGRLTLCCNLSGYRGTTAEPDVAADLTQETFSAALPRVQAIAAAQQTARQIALAQTPTPDLYTGSPCLLCLQSFGKIPWQKTPHARALPIIQPDVLTRAVSGRT